MACFSSFDIWDKWLCRVPVSGGLYNKESAGNFQFIFTMVSPNTNNRNKQSTPRLADISSLKSRVDIGTHERLCCCLLLLKKLAIFCERIKLKRFHVFKVCENCYECNFDTDNASAISNTKLKNYFETKNMFNNMFSLSF